MAPTLNRIPLSRLPGSSMPTRDTSAVDDSPVSASNASSQPASRRVSQTMGPPPLPHTITAGGGLGDNNGVGSGPGPIRHPRPLTIAEIHLELEKEQEAVVNRLTRELSLLRQQTASVASTASSASMNNFIESNEFQNLSSTSYPVSRNRSSSTLSSRSASGVPSYPSGNIGAGVTSIAPSRDSGLPLSSRPSLDFAHQRSASRDVSPSIPSSFQPYGGENFSLSRSTSQSQSRHSRQSSIQNHQHHHHSGGSRHEDMAMQRAELDAVKRENERLRRRVRELEATLREFSQN
ncbi:hypothetical protein FQN57_005553 [Myotisia sp. PD_48]|nr:hypothetical protein FQN57_005553 [Myotisia sp. PD_48]